MVAPVLEPEDLVFLAVSPRQLEILLLAYTRCLAKKQRDFVRCNALESAAIELMDSDKESTQGLTRILMQTVQGGVELPNGWWRQ